MRKFISDTSGATGVIFAVTLFPILMLISTAVEYSRFTRSKTLLQTALDAATLNAVRYPSDQQQTIGAKTLMGNFRLPTVSLSATWTAQPDGSLAGEATASLQTIFPTFLGANTVTASARNKAVLTNPTYTPDTVQFTPLGASGWFWKKVTLWVHRPTNVAGVYTALATYTYQPSYPWRSSPTQYGDPADVTSSPGGTIQLGAYDDAYLSMEVRAEGCAPGYKQLPGAGTTNLPLQCAPGTPGNSYDVTFASNDPSTSNYVFVNSVQQPAGVKIPLIDMTQCGKSVLNAWEDGGGWDHQDFFYQVYATCRVVTPSPASSAKLVL